MAKSMNCEASLFHQTHATPTHVRFACFVRGLTTTPAIIELPKGAIDKEPHLTDDVYEEVLSINRKRVSTNVPDSVPQESDVHPARVSPPNAATVHSPPSQQPRATPESAPEHDDDAASNWS